MKNISILAATVAAFALAVPGVAMAQNAQQQAPARIGENPNINGVWQTMGTANWNVEPHSAGPNPVADRLVGAIGAIPAGLGVVVGGKIPYNDAAQERLAQNKANPVRHDPEGACYLPGIPRATYMGYPFQIVQGTGDDILFVYEYATANRVIHMQEVGIPPIDTWMGTSYGKWEGDTLVVTTLAQGPGDVKLPAGEMIEGVTWLDRAGNYLTNTATVIERFTPRGADHMDYEVTIEDPTVYTEAWTMKMPIYRRVEENAQLLEFRCVPFSEQMLYGDLLENKEGSE
ncbi:hypothetical protein GRI97_05095 [Altererythrobacter xixiisoli]|uniref:Uncharacterized protein n=1 Tax=Croceibacterium xixiisoli TaxID=1476466 RepID=A0A6I4TT40_9SPHN|nr:hypothetical protein [Croceibacterium xixiisoli]MXO98360.1 hypothetical protein [Croceibacterium xixiisoli]